MRSVTRFLAIGLVLLGTVWVGTAQDAVDVILDRVDRAAQLEGDAVILLDWGHVTVLDDGSTEAVFHQQTLVMSWDAIDFYGEVVMSYHDEFEELSLLHARTILPSGEVVAPESSSIYESSFSEGGTGGTYASIKTLHVPMPALRPGAVIDISYALRQKSPIVPGEFFEWWGFAWEDPVLLSEFILDVPMGLGLAWRTNPSGLTPEIQTDSETTRYTFRAEEIPAVPFDPWAPDLAVIASQVSISSMDSWAEIASWWASVIDGKNEPNDAIASAALQMTAGMETDAEKIVEISRFVSREVRYVALAFNMVGFAPRPASETFETRFGDCKDQVMLMMAMLDSVGIESHPLLINTLPGLRLGPEWPPTPYAFDHVVLAIPSETSGWDIYDPTCALCIPGYQDEFIRGRYGLLVTGDDENPGDMIRTAEFDPEATTETCGMVGTLLDDGTLIATCSVESSGEFEIWYREYMSYFRPQERWSGYQDLLGWTIPEARVDAFECSDPEDVFVPLKMTASFQKDRFARSIGGGMLLIPLPYAPTFSDPLTYSGTVMDLERALPLILSPGRCVQQCRIAVPSQYDIELPDDQFVQNSVGHFRSKYWLEDQQIVYERELLLQVDLVSPAAYPEYRDLIQTMVEDAEAMAILR